MINVEGIPDEATVLHTADGTRIVLATAEYGSIRAPFGDLTIAELNELMGGVIEFTDAHDREVTDYYRKYNIGPDTAITLMSAPYFEQPAGSTPKTFARSWARECFRVLISTSSSLSPSGWQPGSSAAGVKSRNPVRHPETV